MRKVTRGIIAAAVAITMTAGLSVIPFAGYEPAVSVSAAEAVISGDCGENAAWMLDSDGKLTISGTGDMDDYARNGEPWYDHRYDITSVEIESGITSIGNSAFDKCLNLKSITIPDSVESIGESAFFGCINLKSITIPDSVESIGADAFKDCDKITTVYCYADPEKLTWNDAKCDDFMSGKNTICFVPDNDYLAKFEKKFGADSEYPVNVTFKVLNLSGNCGENAAWEFDLDTGKLTISGTGDMSDYNNKDRPWYDHRSEITSVEIQSGITSVGYNAFRGCAGLTSITLPDSVTSIGSQTFYRCTGLTSVTLPGSVTSIGGNAFEGCTGLTSVTLPDSVESIGGYVFKDCTGLTSITIPNSVTSIGGHAFKDCTGLTSVTLPDSVTSIGVHAFHGCTGLTSVTIPDSVTSIGSYAFRGCKGLTSVTIPDSVTSIEEAAFSDCTSLTSITIPDSVTSIGNSAFRKCTGLTSITIPDSVTSIGIQAFANCTSLTTIDIPSSVTSIGSDAFVKCTSLTSIDIPGSVTSIGGTAFFGCSSLTSADISDGVTSIGVGMFNDCTHLATIDIPDSVSSIGAHAFENCAALKWVRIPQSVTEIKKDAFKNCSSLSDIYFGGTQEQWDALDKSEANIPEGVTVHCEGVTVTVTGGVIHDIDSDTDTADTSITVPADGHAAVSAPETNAEGVPFTGWRVGDNIVSTNNIFMFTVKTNVTITAVYGETAPPVDAYKSDFDFGRKINPSNNEKDVLDLHSSYTVNDRNYYFRGAGYLYTTGNRTAEELKDPAEGVNVRNKFKSGNYYNMYYDITVSVKTDKEWTVMPYYKVYDRSTKTETTYYGAVKVLETIRSE